jgi:hypothetical protein
MNSLQSILSNLFVLLLALYVLINKTVLLVISVKAFNG